MRLNVRLAIFLLIVSILFGCQSTQVKEQNKRLEIAKAMFEDRCKKAGVFIYKTVKDVDGILLMKVRPERINYADQYRMDDPYGRDFGGEDYIMSLVRGNFDSMRSMNPKPGWPKRNGYSYIEATNSEDGLRYRYTGKIEKVMKTSSVIGGGDGRGRFSVSEFVLKATIVTGPPPRYGITYDDISTSEDRKYWIAGSSLRVIDLGTKEVIAERIGYMVDYAQGDRSGGRSPWLMAARNACPSFNRYPGAAVKTPSYSQQNRQTQDFVEKVLIPRTEE